MKITIVSSVWDVWAFILRFSNTILFYIIQQALVFSPFLLLVCLFVSCTNFHRKYFSFCVHFPPVWDMKIKPKRKQTSNKTSLFYRYKSSNSFFICFIIHEHFTSMIYLLDFLLCCAFHSWIFFFLVIVLWQSL